MREEKIRSLMDAMVGKSFFYNGQKEYFEKYEINFEKKWVVVTTDHAAFRRHPIANLQECLSEYRKEICPTIKNISEIKKLPPNFVTDEQIDKLEDIRTKLTLDKNTIAKEPDYLQKVFYLRFGTASGNWIECEMCKKLVEFARVPGLPYYQCPACNHELYPIKDTVFENTGISISQWLHGFSILDKEMISAKILSLVMHISRGNAFKIRITYETYIRNGSIMKRDHIQ